MGNRLKAEGFDDGKVIVLQDDDPNAAPVRNGIFDGLGRLNQHGLDEDDSILFKFSGHEMMYNDVDYLLPIDASDVALKQTAVSVEEAVEWWSLISNKWLDTDKFGR